MFKAIRHFVLILLSAIIVFSHVGCTTRTYACEIIESEIEDAGSNGPDSLKTEIEINSNKFQLAFINCKKSCYTDKLLYDYEVAGESSELLKGRVRTDAETGELVGFWNVDAFPEISDIDTLNDAEIKNAAESILHGLDDFSGYNTFSVKRLNGVHPEYCLVWEVKRKLLCHVGAVAYVSDRGDISSFCKTDACPEELADSPVDENERNRLLEKEICDYLGYDSLKNIEYEIQSEVLTYYHCAPAVSYYVKIIDDGFVQIKQFVIYVKK